MLDRPRVLVIAEAANPDWVSVPLVGWSLASALSDVADVHLVTQVRNRSAILNAGLVEGRDVTFIDTEPLLRPLWRLASVLRMGKGKGWTTMTAISGLAYPYFERLVWRQFGPSIRAGDYDLIHRVTPLTPTAISPIAAKCRSAGVPFVMGPLNGGVPWPSGFDNARWKEREWLSYVRSAYKLMPGRRRTLKNAAAIIAGSRYTQGEIPAAYRDKTIWIPENAIDPARFKRVRALRKPGPLRAAFVGRLVPYKGPDMLIEAACELLKAGRMTLDFVGDGPMRAALEETVHRAGLGKAVSFHGQVPHADVETILTGADILSFPSIREFGGGVVLEAMALGVVPVVVNYAGPGELVDPEVGYPVPLGTRDDIVTGFRDVLAQLADDPSALAVASAAARARATTDFTWQAKARQIAEVYDWVLGYRSVRPDPLGAR